MGNEDGNELSFSESEPFGKQEIKLLDGLVDWRKVFPKKGRPDLRKKLTAGLKEKGYTNSVIVDEINAYMATSGTKYLKTEFDLEVTRKDIKPFVDLAKTVL